MNVDELIAHVGDLAVQQHGLVRTDQVPTADVDRLRYLARRGIVERLTRGVYRLTGAPVTWHQRLQAMVWALGPGAVVSHRSAGRLLGLDRFDDDVVELTVERSSRGRAPSGIDAIVHSTVFRTRADTTTRDGLPVTSVERTIVDLARIGTATVRLEAAIDSAQRLRLTTLDRVIDRVADLRGGGRAGTRQLDVLLLTSGGHTLLERRFLELVRRAGLPVPTPQVVHRRDGRHIARVDFLFEAADLVVEVSGGRGHSSPSDRAKDARRRNDLQQAGRTVLEFTYEDVTQREAMVLESLERSLGRPVRLSGPGVLEA